MDPDEMLVALAEAYGRNDHDGLALVVRNITQSPATVASVLLSLLGLVDQQRTAA